LNILFSSRKGCCGGRFNERIELLTDFFAGEFPLLGKTRFFFEIFREIQNPLKTRAKGCFQDSLIGSTDNFPKQKNTPTSARTASAIPHRARVSRIEVVLLKHGKFQKPGTKSVT